MINAIGKKDSVIGKIDSANSLFYAPYASPRARRYPLSYILAGRYVWDSGDLSLQGQHGNWQTSTGNSTDKMSTLAINSTSLLNPSDYNDKIRSWSLRWRRAKLYSLVVSFWKLIIPLAAAR